MLSARCTVPLKLSSHRLLSLSVLDISVVMPSVISGGVMLSPAERFTTILVFLLFFLQFLTFSRQKRKQSLCESLECISVCSNTPEFFQCGV